MLLFKLRWSPIWQYQFHDSPELRRGRWRGRSKCLPWWPQYWRERRQWRRTGVSTARETGTTRDHPCQGYGKKEHAIHPSLLVSFQFHLKTYQPWACPWMLILSLLYIGSYNEKWLIGQHCQTCVLVFTQETLDNASTGKVTDQPLGGVAPAVVLSSLPRNSLEIRTAKFPYLEGLLWNVLLELAVVSRQRPQYVNHTVI